MQEFLSLLCLDKSSYAETVRRDEVYPIPSRASTFLIPVRSRLSEAAPYDPASVQHFRCKTGVPGLAGMAFAAPAIAPAAAIS